MPERKYYKPVEEKFGVGKKGGGPIIGRIELCYAGRVVVAIKYNGRAHRKVHIEKMNKRAKRCPGAYITIIPE